MKRIELFERAIAEKARNLKDYGINSTMFWAYRKSIEAGKQAGVPQPEKEERISTNYIR